MGKVMKQLPFGLLMEWALAEYARSGSLFGVDASYRAVGGGRLALFGERLELPFGPAAGPHTQLAQNIIAGYAAGARFFELKTVQILDGEELPVSKPCIAAPDECYNVEWSTELYVPQALDEYVKAWFALKLLCREFGFSSDGTGNGRIGDYAHIDGGGFIFNMSVGYDFEGVRSKKIDGFIEGLKNAENTGPWKICKQWAISNLQRFKIVDREYIDAISPRICSSITLSTLHGCPPEEIERIASYLLTEKKLHTFVKCNPTLLGYEYARETLDRLGFDYIVFDERHFKADLQFTDAVRIFQRLQTLADSFSLNFGVKLTNTFPVHIMEGELPGDEMYMSGRALYPLSLEVAVRLSEAFGGNLRISFSGGADARNIEGLVDAGIWPVTLATTLLKPGGYSRARQIAGILDSRPPKPYTGVSLEKLQSLTDAALSAPMYRKPPGRPPERKISAPIPLLDCFTAPCRGACPISQDIPAYLRLAGEGKHLDALRVIAERNPLPFITGTICPQFCAGKCARVFYEGPVNIRAVKLETAASAFAELLPEIENKPKSGGKIAVIGGGPAGLSAAYFLAKAGRPVTVFEKTDSLGGIVRHVIPVFRIGEGAISNDIELVKATGVKFRLNTEVRCLDALRAEGFEQIIIAVGAWKQDAPGLPGAVAAAGITPVQDALTFLGRLKRAPHEVKLGESVVVVGGGNTAIDAARAATRVVGVANVSIVYRRTKRYMPADAEELSLAQEDGVQFRELLSPVSLDNGILTCERMSLGAPGASGRREPMPAGEFARIPADAVIFATGSHVDAELLADLNVPTNRMGEALVNAETYETRLPGVYIIGDATRGPSTVVEAIADASRCAAAIAGAGADTGRYESLNINPDTAAVTSKKGVLYSDCGPANTPDRCLECATLCERCVEVCPNRANISVMADGRRQIIHIGDMCNECGNCETFCPYTGAPFMDKPALQILPRR